MSSKVSVALSSNLEYDSVEMLGEFGGDIDPAAIKFAARKNSFSSSL